MKYTVWLLLILCVACTKSDRVPDEEDFSVAVRQATDGELKSNEDFELIAELTNLSKHSVKILHAAPLIQVQIYDEQDKPLIDMFVTNTIGLNRDLKPNESYSPDSKNYNGGKRTVKVEKPGRYKLVGTASFSMEPGNGERKDYKIVSDPVWITVEEGKRKLAATDNGRFQLSVDAGSQVDGGYTQVTISDDSGNHSQAFDWQIDKLSDANVPDLQLADLNNDGIDELVVMWDNNAHVIDTRDMSEIVVESAAAYLERTMKSQIIQKDGYVWLQLSDDNGQLFTRAIDSNELTEWGDSIQFDGFVQYKVVDRPLRLYATAEAFVGAGEEKLKLGQIALSYGFTKQGVTVDLAGGFQWGTEIKGDIPLYAIQAGGGYPSLWESSDIDAKALLGEPIKESTRQLGPEADTFNGTYLKTLTYEGLELTLASGDGEKFYLINMKVTDSRYPTSLGIRIGDTLEQVEAAYPSIEVAKDGREPPRNYAYTLGEGFPFGLLIDIKDGIVNELYLEYLMD